MEFDEITRNKLGDLITVVKELDKPDPDLDDANLMEGDDEPLVLLEEDLVDSKVKAVYQQPFTNMLISAEVLLPLEGEVRKPK